MLTSQAATVLGAAAAVEGVAPPACACACACGLPCKLRMRLPHDLALGRPDAIRCAVSKGHAMSCNLFGAAKHQSGLSCSQSRAQARIMFHTRRPVPEGSPEPETCSWVFARHEERQAHFAHFLHEPRRHAMANPLRPAGCDQPSSTTVACS